MLNLCADNCNIVFSYLTIRDVLQLACTSRVYRTFVQIATEKHPIRCTLVLINNLACKRDIFYGVQISDAYMEKLKSVGAKGTLYIQSGKSIFTYNTLGNYISTITVQHYNYSLFNLLRLCSYILEHTIQVGINNCNWLQAPKDLYSDVLMKNPVSVKLDLSIASNQPYSDNNILDQKYMMLCTKLWFKVRCRACGRICPNDCYGYIQSVHNGPYFCSVECIERLLSKPSQIISYKLTHDKISCNVCGCDHSLGYTMYTEQFERDMYVCNDQCVEKYLVSSRYNHLNIDFSVL